ncbi:MAG: nitroreductase family protein [Rhabdochlamydiaceae bacterium]
MSTRKFNYPILPVLENRWSPRAMTGEEISDEVLFSLFEAARWAPSASNNQPWRFIYAKRNTPEWDVFFDLLVEFNQNWVKNAAVIVVALSKNTFDRNGKFSRTHSFDTGAAWMSLALQGSSEGLVVHGMEGFNYDKAKTALNVPDDHTVEMMLAIGKRAPKETLPKDLQEREFPSLRRPLEEIVMKGKVSSGVGMIKSLGDSVSLRVISKLFFLFHSAQSLSLIKIKRFAAV